MPSLHRPPREVRLQLAARGAVWPRLRAAGQNAAPLPLRLA